MNVNNQMIEYKKESFFSKIKQKIVSFFTRKNQAKEIIEKPKTMINKKEFFDIYSNVKNKDINLDELSNDTLYKVMIMLDEEMSVNLKKIEEKKNKIDISINNIKIYNKEIELLKRKA